MIKLSQPPVGRDEIDEVRKVLLSGRLVQGDRVKEFESAVARFVGCRCAVAVSSGTAALHLALLALGVGPGDEVIVPDFTFPATANVVESVGARPVLCDIDPSTYNLDPERLEQKVTPQTKAIIPVHLFGLPAEMDKVMAVAEKYQLKVVEDAACALGASYRGRMCGSFGHVGCFSFHPRKVITTGEGGVLTTDAPLLAEKLTLLRNHGMLPGENGFRFTAAGLNYRMTEMQAAIGLSQMRKISGVISSRLRLAGHYSIFLAAQDAVVVPRPQPGAKHIFQSYVLLLKKPGLRDLAIKELARQGIEAAIGTYAIHRQPYYINKYGYSKGECENSLRAYENSLSLPLYPGLTREEVSRVAGTLLKFLH